MAYLEPSEYVAYGLSADTSDAWVEAASSMIEAHCRRSSLLATSYTERLRVARQSGSVQLTYAPVAQVNAVQARYALNARVNEGLLLEWTLAFGAPGQWVAVDPTTVILDAASG